MADSTETLTQSEPVKAFPFYGWMTTPIVKPAPGEQREYVRANDDGTTTKVIDDAYEHELAAFERELSCMAGAVARFLYERFATGEKIGIKVTFERDEEHFTAKDGA